MGRSETLSESLKSRAIIQMMWRNKVRYGTVC